MHQPHGSIYLKDKEAAIPEVKRWLLDTYEVKTGAMVPKKTVYDAYRSFCARCDFEPSDVSSFGKIFKRVFPEVDRKRLVKGWHYCNLAPRASAAGDPTGPSPPTDRLYHSDPVVPTASLHSSSLHAATGGRPLSPPPRAQSRSASPVSMAITRSRSPSPSSMAIVRRAHSQSPVPTSPRHLAHHQNPPPLSPALLRPVSPHLIRPLPLHHHPHPLFHPQPQPQHVQQLHPQPPHQHSSPHHLQHPTPLSFFLASTGHHRLRRNTRPPPVAVAEQEMADVPPHVEGEKKGTDEKMLVGACSPGVAVDIWNSGTHLQLMSEVEYYVGIYRREVWGLNPVNPAALDPDLLRYLLTTEDGANERSPLSLCVHVALSLGSTFAGEFRRGREWMNKLRHQMSEVFDASDYDVACVLRHLALICRVYADSEKEGLEKCSYYLALGRQICENIGAINDENYLIILKMSSVYEKVDVEERLAFAPTQPRWRKNWVGDYPFIENYKYGKIAEMARDDLFDIPKNIHLLIDPPTTSGPASSKPVRSGIGDQLARLGEFEAKLGDLSEAYGSIHSLKMLRAFVFFLRTVCNAVLHQIDDALESALDFVQLVSELMRPYQAVCFVELSSKTVYMDSIIQALLQAGRYDKLQELAEMAQPLTKEFGTITTFCQFMLDSLAAYQHRLTGHPQPTLASPNPAAAVPSPSVSAMMTSPPPPVPSSPPSVTVPPPPLPSFSMYATLHAALPVLPPLLPPQPGLDGYYRTSSVPARAQSDCSTSSSSLPSVGSSVISPDRPDDQDDVEGLHAYISSFLDQNL